MKTERYTYISDVIIKNFFFYWKNFQYLEFLCINKKYFFVSFTTRFFPIFQSFLQNLFLGYQYALQYTYRLLIHLYELTMFYVIKLFLATFRAV